MWTWLAAYGVSSSLLILLIGMPAVYYLLAFDAHKDFSDTLANMHKNSVVLDAEAVDSYKAGGRDMLDSFELEWWIILAFAILISSVLISGYVIPARSSQCLTDAAKAGECLDLKSGMALYAAMIGLAVAFRLAWIRLSLLRYTANFQVERIKVSLTAGAAPPAKPARTKGK